MTEVELGAEGVAVTIGPRTLGCAGLGVVFLTGGSIEVDPAVPALLSTMALPDASTAGEVLDECWRAADGEADASKIVFAEAGHAVDLVPSGALQSLLRLGILDWLDTMSPDPLNQIWLDVEMAVGALELRELVADADEIASSRLAAHLDAVVSLAEGLRTGRVALPPAADRLVHRALIGALDVVELSADQKSDVRHAAELMTALDRLGVDRVDWDSLVADLDDVAVQTRALVGAEHAGVDDYTSHSMVVRGSGSVDWRQVPRGWLDPGEQTVSWAVDRESGRVEVDVLAGYRAATAGALAYRILAADGSLLGTGPLVLHQSGRLFSGSGRVVDNPVSVVDVYDPINFSTVRTGAAGVAAEAERAAARAISLCRLVGVEDPTRTVPAVDQLQRSERLYRAAERASGATESTRSWAAGLAQRRAEALDALDRMASSTGRERLRTRTAAGLLNVGRSSPVGRIDTELTVTELALLTGLPES